MSLRRAAVALAIAALVSLALTLAAHAVQAETSQSDEAQPDPSLSVEWAFRPNDVGELADASPAAVVAKVEGVRPGDDFIASDADGASDPLVLPTQRVNVQVTQTLDGSVPEQLTLFKLGAPGYQPTGDPAYRVGETYLLFVERRPAEDGSGVDPDGTYIATAPDGRLERSSSGELEPVIEGPVAAELEGLSVSEADQVIDEAEGQ